MSIRAGIDLGGTKIQAVIVGESNQVLGQARRPTPTEGGPADVADALIAAAHEAASAASIETSSLTGVGIGSPGSIDADRGTVSQARNLPGWDGTFALAAVLEKDFNVPIKIGNDVAVETKAEAVLGAGKQHRSFLGVAWGTGVGGGIILKGEQWFGRGDAAEIGHMVVKIGGRHCGCGRRGCMEAYAGRAAMEAHARSLVNKGHKTDLFEIMEARGRDRLTSGIWERALKRNDKMATELIDEAVNALGAGIASAVNLLDVGCVVLSGGLGTRFGDPMAERIKQSMMPHLFNDRRPPELLASTLGDLGGAIGAALLV